MDIEKNAEADEKIQIFYNYGTSVVIPTVNSQSLR